MKSKRRIALFAKGVIGGGNLGYGIPVLRDLFDRLSHDFDIVLYSFSQVDESDILPGIRVRRITPRLPAMLGTLFLAALFAVDHLRSKYSAIFAVSVSPAGSWANRMGRLFNVPVLVQIIGLEAVALPEINAGNLLMPALREITIKVCEKATVLIAVAEYQKKLALKYLSVQREINVLPLRIDYRKFPYRKRKVILPVQFIHVAYYSPIKGQDIMFAVFAEVHKHVPCQLKVIGAGYDNEEVAQMMKNFGIGRSVHFLGELDQTKIPEHYADAHIMLHTARFETGCAVIQEAMASGVAVGGTRVGILADIGDDYAIIAEPAEPKLLAEKLIELISDEKRYEKLTAKAYQWISTYDSIWSYRNYRETIQKIVDNQS